MRLTDQPPVYDTREHPVPYHITTWVGGHIAEWQESLPDPFVNHTIRTKFTLRQRVAILFGREWVVSVHIGATDDVQEAVLELDANYRGQSGSIRRAESDALLNHALKNFNG